jgi:hypothetical protein
MGNGIKVPESERPPFSLISKRLDDRVSRKIQNIFVQDIQNDCTCSIEVYDRDIDKVVVYLSSDGTKEMSFGDRFPLPMLEDLSTDNIYDLLKRACELASHTRPQNMFFARMLYNPESNPEAVDRALNELGSSIVIRGRDGVILTESMPTIGLSFVPKDSVFFLPDPEFFGAISVNIDKFGAFCFPQNMMRKEL